MVPVDKPETKSIHDQLMQVMAQAYYRAGDLPKYRLNFATSRMYDCCVAGDRLRIVISSIIRRRSGLIVAIGLSCLGD